MNTILLMQAGSTLALVGLIWMVHVVHYPLMAMVGTGFQRYHEAHCARIAWLVAPLMGLELIGATLGVIERPAVVPPAEAWLGVGLVAVCWLVTGLRSVPAHSRLARGFDAAAHRRLMLADRVRTAAWSARGVLVLIWLNRGLRDAGQL